MAAPVAGTRTTPSGIYLHDGYSTKISPAADPDVSFWETIVSPPGMDGGEAIDTTTMHNADYRTRRPRALITLTDMTVTAAYDPAVLTQIAALVNVETTWTVLFPDGSTWAFYGFLKLFDPNDNVEGTMPTAAVTIVPTNYDPTNKVEAGPALVSVAGT